MGLPFAIESWIWYGVGVFAIAIRFLARTTHLKSVKKLQIDDWFMAVALVTDTAFMVTINLVANYNSNLIAPQDNVSSFSPDEIRKRVYGSKLILVVEQMQCCTTWLVKGCLIALYIRVTTGLQAHTAVRLLAVYIGVTFAVMEILYLGVWCRPIQNYWAVPTPNPQCSAATNHLITNAVFNLTSDIAMMSIAFWLFLGNHLSWSRKLILCFVFGLGLFTILSAVLNKYYSFTHPFGNQWPFWYVRESSTAIIVANMPFSWSLLRRTFNLNSFDDERHHTTAARFHTARSAQGRSDKHQILEPHIPIPVRHNLSPPPMSRAVSSHNSPTHTHVHSMVADHKYRSLRDHGVYGLLDADALDVDQWDSGNDEIVKVTSHNSAKVSSDAASSMITPPSPVALDFGGSKRPGSGSWRLKDETRQWSMQADMRTHYHDYTTHRVDDEMLDEKDEKESEKEDV